MGHTRRPCSARPLVGPPAGDTEPRPGRLFWSGEPLTADTERFGDTWRADVLIALSVRIDEREELLDDGVRILLREEMPAVEYLACHAGAKRCRCRAGSTSARLAVGVSCLSSGSRCCGQLSRALVDEVGEPFAEEHRFGARPAITARGHSEQALFCRNVDVDHFLQEPLLDERSRQPPRRESDLTR